MKVQPLVYYVGIISLASSSGLTGTVLAFTPVWSRIIRASGGGSMNPPPPPPRDPSDGMSHFDDGDDDDWNKHNNIIASSMLGILNHDHDSEETARPSDDKAISNLTEMRGGSNTKLKPSNDVIAGSKSSLQMTQMYWSDVFESLKTKVGEMNPFKSKIQDEDEIDPRTVQVQAVIAPNSDILPDNVVRSAAQRSGMLGSVMRTDRVKECARHLKKWYVQRGYILHSVTGATLHSDTATATLTVQEPILSSKPLDIRFAKEVLIDPESGKTTTRRKYREKLERRKGRTLRQQEWVAITSNLNTTLVEAKGRTNPHTLSNRMGLQPGRHFQWDGSRWQRIAQSGIFEKIWRANPVQMDDGTVQMQVLCQESPPRNLEYGVSKSLYTGHWVSSNLKLLESFIKTFYWKETRTFLTFSRFC